MCRRRNIIKHFTNIVIGAGLSGAVIAERLASVLNEDVLVIDKRTHVAGNVFDYYDKNGICVHKYGPHIFHTELENVWEYLSKFTKWEYYFFKPQIIIDGNNVNLPFNLNSLYCVFPENLAVQLSDKLIKKYGYNKKVSILELKTQKDKYLKFLSKYIYKNVFEQYTIKQWGLKPEEIDPSITARVPIYISKDDRYFHDKYQGIPLEGYTKMVENILNNSKIKILLNKNYNEIKNEYSYNRLFFTGSIDEFFNYKYGLLPYRSLKFDIQEKNVEFYQPTAMVNYPNNYNFTRITEHKHFLKNKSDKTVISIEYPQSFELDKNERFYPITADKNHQLYQKYLDESKEMNNVYFCGRLGNYKYLNMDLAVDNALKLVEGLM